MVDPSGSCSSSAFTVVEASTIASRSSSMAPIRARIAARSILSKSRAADSSIFKVSLPAAQPPDGSRATTAGPVRPAARTNRQKSFGLSCCDRSDVVSGPAQFEWIARWKRAFKISLECSLRLSLLGLLLELSFRVVRLDRRGRFRRFDVCDGRIRGRWHTGALPGGLPPKQIVKRSHEAGGQ